ncbi:MAG TPA: TatD family hydrolase [Candidatus Saccharimonadales bacterium]|nr:TatD family hydrolase [Candidatus Saccharimonadales bacterium]
MELVDTHCHIQSAGLSRGERTTRELWAKAPELTGDAIIKNAVRAGVMRLVCVGCDLADSRLAVEFVQDRPQCWASIGIHPHEAQHYASRPDKLDEFAALATQPKVVAIGECGLDYFYAHSPKADQALALRYQLELAVQYQLPLIFHVREAFDDFWPIFDDYRGVKGVLHSFTDSAANLDKALARGLYLGVNGIATFAKNPRQLEMYRSIPLQKLLLETDAPFLTPSPYRGSINEPMQVGTISKFLAELRDEDHQELARVTTSNARQLFGI